MTMNSWNVPPLLRKIFGKSTGSFVASTVSMLMMFFIVKGLVTWGIANASFSVETPQQCIGTAGACWPAVTQRIGVIFFGLYPTDQLWRAETGLFILIAAIICTCIPAFWTARRIVGIWAFLGSAFVILMRGGIFGLPPVPTSLWGGFSLNLFIFFCVVVAGMPIAVVLALMRQSELPGIRFVASAFIDLTRSMPLLGILFFAVLIFPLVLPRGIETDTLFRVIVAFAFFFGCYEAEVLRGGFQSIAKGQIEASDSLGLNYWQRNRLILLPQVFQKFFPATLNQFVITFKENSLVFIVGLFDVLRAADVSISTPGWGPFYMEVYLFIALLLFLVTSSLTAYGRTIERNTSGALIRNK